VPVEEQERPIVVFVGPSLKVVRARQVLPQALYLPPVQAGDVLRALRLSPVAIVILDGVFESTAAVWHKEIAVALAKGVAVIGAASMGALRAAEMAAFGMLGIGKIYEDYRSGRLTDDDDVALIHNDLGEPLSDAMVDIQATVASGVASGLIGNRSAEAILRSAKNTFYPMRTLGAALEQARKDLGPNKELEEFETHCSEGGRVYQKKADSEAALRAVASMARHGNWPAPAALSVPNTFHLQQIQHEVSCRPFSICSPDLPLDEQVASAARFLGRPYIQAKEMARLLATVSAVAPNHKVEDSSASQDPLFSDFGSQSWLDQAHLTSATAQPLGHRIRAIEALESIVLQDTRLKRKGAAGHISWLLRTRLERYVQWVLAVEYLDGGRDQGHAPSSRQTARARLWRTIDLLCFTENIVPTHATLQDFFEEWRDVNGLATEEQLTNWLAATGLSGFEEFMQSLYLYTSAKDNRTLRLLRADLPTVDPTVCWFIDALRLTNQYSAAKRLIGLPIDELKKVATLPSTDNEAYSYDFERGFYHVQLDLGRLAGTQVDPGQ